MKVRLSKIMSDAGLNASQFADAVGIQRAAVSHIMAGRNNPSLDVISKVLTSFSYINPDWLLFGTGAMKREADSKNSKPQSLFPPDQPEAFAPLGLTVNGAPTQPLALPAVEKTAEKAVEKAVEKTVETVDADTHSKAMTAKSAANDIDLEIREQLPPKIDRILIFYTDSTYATYMKV